MAWNVCTNYDNKCQGDNPKCKTCSYNGSLNDWHTEFAIGHIAIHFRDWPNIVDQFINQINEIVGSTVKYVYVKH